MSMLDTRRVMKLVMSIVADDRHADGLDVQVSFHLNAGVDAILVAEDGIGDAVRSVLMPHLSPAPFTS